MCCRKYGYYKRLGFAPELKKTLILQRMVFRTGGLGIYKYIAVDKILYTYALPIDYFLLSYSKLCFSYNLSQA